MTDLEMRIQSPGGDIQLVDHLAEGAVGQNSGGALIAWATADGFNKFVERPEIAAVLTHGSFGLVVGIDSITNTRALDRFERALAEFPGLRIKVFVHSKPGTLFHPKCVWFCDEAGARIFVGSGNLTVAGLTRNWEAWTAISCPTAQALPLFKPLMDWLVEAENEGLLYDVTHEVARERAALNVGRERDQIARNSTRPASAEAENPPVFLTDLSKNRAGQVEVGINAFTTFFGASIGSASSAELYFVKSDGEIGAGEERNLIETQPRNFRFELSGLHESGAVAVDGPRPIVVFVKTQGSVFFYSVVQEGDEAYEGVSELLGPGSSVRRTIVSLADLKAAWPNSPLLVAVERDV